MARSPFFNLWGQKAATEDDPEKDKEKEGTSAGGAAAEGEEDDDEATGDDREDEATAEFDDEDEEEEDDEATKAEIAKVSSKARASIRRAERRRILGIVRAAGPDRVEAGLTLAFGTRLSASAAAMALNATGTAPAAQPAGGRLGLSGSLDGRRRQPLGADASAASADTGGKLDVDKIAAFIRGAGKS